jgi:hypothetical protein
MYNEYNLHKIYANTPKFSEGNDEKKVTRQELIKAGGSADGNLRVRNNKKDALTQAETCRRSKFHLRKPATLG